jgi:predicted TIM-barrel fold metal-dependent hydrolase
VDILISEYAARPENVPWDDEGVRIDAWVSFVDRSRFDYAWMPAAAPHMHRDFSPDDLWRILARNKFEGVIARPLLGVQAEIDWLTDLRARHPWILGVSGPRPDVLETGGFDETPREILEAHEGVVLLRGFRLAEGERHREFVPWVFDRFGPERVMYGSQWPLCMHEGTWKESLAAFTQGLGARTMEEREWILGGTAARVYGGKECYPQGKES